ncbi:MAG: hypothetical protein V4722_27720 [Bacteroidota bacterium]
MLIVLLGADHISHNVDGLAVWWSSVLRQPIAAAKCINKSSLVALLPGFIRPLKPMLISDMKSIDRPSPDMPPNRMLHACGSSIKQLNIHKQSPCLVNNGDTINAIFLGKCSQFLVIVNLKCIVSTPRKIYRCRVKRCLSMVIVNSKSVANFARIKYASAT